MDDKDREAVEWLAASIREGSPMDPRNVEHMKMAERILALAKRALQMEEGGYYSIDDIPFYAEAPDE